MTIAYLLACAGLLLGGVVLFRVFVRGDYRRRGRLAPLTSALELGLWLLYVCLPYLYNPTDWWSVWFADTPVVSVQKVLGSLLVGAGMAVALVAVTRIGIRTTMGERAGGLRQSGLYRLSRNPQLVGGGIAVLGVVVLWPSWYALGWAVLYGALGHLMVLAEEEHLQAVHGGNYARYCSHVPRYLGVPK